MLDGETYGISMDCRETKLLPVNVTVTETAKICFSNYELASILEEDGRTVVWLYGIGNAVLTVEEKGVSDTICIGEPENGRRVQKGRLLFALAAMITSLSTDCRFYRRLQYRRENRKKMYPVCGRPFMTVNWKRSSARMERLFR